MARKLKLNYECPWCNHKHEETKEVEPWRWVVDMCQCGNCSEQFILGIYDDTQINESWCGVLKWDGGTFTMAKELATPGIASVEGAGDDELLEEERLEEQWQNLKTYYKGTHKLEALFHLYPQLNDVSMVELVSVIMDEYVESLEQFETFLDVFKEVYLDSCFTYDDLRDVESLDEVVFKSIFNMGGFTPWGYLNIPYSEIDHHDLSPYFDGQVINDLIKEDKHKFLAINEALDLTTLSSAEIKEIFERSSLFYGQDIKADFSKVTDTLRNLGQVGSDMSSEVYHAFFNRNQYGEHFTRQNNYGGFTKYGYILIPRYDLTVESIINGTWEREWE